MASPTCAVPHRGPGTRSTSDPIPRRRRRPIRTGTAGAPAGPRGARPPRHWAAFYLSPNGRVARADYWLYGVLVPTAVNLLVGGIRVLGLVASLALAWSAVVLAIKRCHDVNRSGWWSWRPYVPLMAALAAIPLSAAKGHHTTVAVAVALVAVCGLAAIATAAWVFVRILIRRGDMDANRYGPPTVRIEP